MPNKPEKNISEAKNPGYLPNFCDSEVFLRLLLVIELIAIVFSLVGFSSGSLLVHIALISVIVLWVGLSVALLLCWFSRMRWLESHVSASIIAIAATLSMTLLVSLLSISAESIMQLDQTGHDITYILLRNLTVAAILVGMALRYFYVQYESEMILKVQAQARLQALQARIRPHFLFNSMNTIASLTHDQPDLAEHAIENLSDLFRASLSAEASISLQQELELTRSYVDLEALRLGDRLSVNWHTPEIKPDLNLPALTLQPLVENAIYHGVEPLPLGGSIDVSIEPHEDYIEISIENPRVDDTLGRNRKGNQMAVDNIRERLAITYAGAASMQVKETDTRYKVTLKIPRGEMK